MSEFGILTRAQLTEIFSLNTKSKKEKKKAAGLAGMILGISALALFISIVYNWLIFMTLEVTNSLEYYLPLVFILTTLIILVTGIIKIKASLFGNKDYNLLESLPVKHSSIIASKIFVIYLYELLFSVAFIAPAIVLMLIHQFDITILLFGLLGTILLPTFPILIGGLLGIPMAFLFDKTKYGSIISFILYIIYIVLLMLFIYGKSTDEGKALMYSNMVLSVNKFYFISNWFTKGLQGDYLSIALFTIVHIAFITIFIVLCSLFYKKINSRILNRSIKTNYVSKKLESSSIGKAIIKKEISKVFSSTNYLVNSMLGGIMSIIMIVIMYFSFKGPMGKNFEAFLPKLYPFMIIMICFGIGMSPVSNSNISIEGESFWILKTAPIREISIIKYKTITPILLLAPFSIISSIISIILFKCNIVGSIAMVIIPLLYLVTISVLGMVIQLSYPKLHFKNELEVIKQSASVVITMFVGMGIEVVMALITVFVGLFVNMYLAYLVTAIFLLALSIGFIIYLNKIGPRKYRAIS
ncbi:MAG: hypothetical protein ACI35W_01825 [Anaeroplasmataceae bacterium]